jgi:hypothetical protein
MEEGGGWMAVVPESFAGSGECGGVGGGGWSCGPVEKLAVGGVAEVVVGVAVGLVEGEGADNDGEGAEGFGRVGGAAFAGDDALDIGFEREGDGKDKLAVASGDGEGMAEGEGLVVRGERDGAGDGERRDRGAVGEYEFGVRGANGYWGLGSRVWGVGWAAWGVGSGVWGLGSLAAEKKLAPRRRTRKEKWMRGFMGAPS